ncbi:MAG TPA: flagellar hook-basal body complex protein FliE [Terriglobales bacterium]|nr:flagellar hook-basal body complex protein FliE [Terriglobales bacterium]
MSNFSSITPWLPGQTGVSNSSLSSPLSSPSSSPAGEQGDFGSTLSDAIDKVEMVHTSAQQQMQGLLQGDRQDIHNVMIAVEKADVAFQLMMQVRNKIVNAYEEISKLQF